METAENPFYFTVSDSLCGECVNKIAFNAYLYKVRIDGIICNISGKYVEFSSEMAAGFDNYFRKCYFVFT